MTTRNDPLPPSVFFRPSMAPGVDQCASYMLRSDGLDIQDAAGERADLGTALHDIFYGHVFPGKSIDQFALAFYSDKHQVDVGGYDGIQWRASKLEKQWQDLKEFYPDPHREERIGYTLPNGKEHAGTPDLWQDNGDYACVLDAKFGESAYQHRAQLLDYCLILYKVKGFQEFYATIFNPVQDYYETWKFTLDHILTWERELLRKMTVAGEEFRRGPMCRVCPNLTTCPAHLREAKAYLGLMGRDKNVVLPRIRPEIIKQIRPVMHHLERVVEHYKETEKALVQQYGTIDLGDGYELAQATRFNKRYHAGIATKVLTEKMGIPQEDIIPRLKLTAAAVEELAALVAPKRKKGETIRTAKEMLKAADAYIEEPVHYTQMRRKRLPADVQEAEFDG